ncbi:MAG: hypothetical protein DKM50_13945 [Candidatus Margulisiibacteriota bacterium]|nr:MAG: hypothetical protein A2X43_01185 [Candidatus Margulisbacteria bacterium GWD2_39_127]OGI03334.1 MAG: hypothetical protein A2X42_06970 [Candidatus Margulisbacteria bacterium GWF2_38_17]OGI12018.1 MAG: hypothetical protein A2X41_03050 [Candidatus Margulisbacteria bacterium GWE2_39_32]PZM77035.1 MAG: hypothetical protein DKM50_13945 [Candidatus Margulisiibacteriota bacterium]
MKKLKILVVDDDKSIRQVLTFALREYYDVTALSDGQEAIDCLYVEHFDIILLDIRMPRLNGIEALKIIQKIAPDTDVIMVTATINSDITSSTMKLGALNYLTKPFEMEDLLKILFKISKKKHIMDKSNKIQDQIVESNEFGELIGESVEIKSIRSFISEVSGTGSTVLISGNKGAEHDLIAHSIYQNSNYKEAFKVVNCASSSQVLEEELFGRVFEDKDFNEMPAIGFLKIGDGGTLYIKNIEKMPLFTQRKVVAWLEDRFKGPVNPEIKIRIILSTTVDIPENIQDKTFDEELFHYINESTISIPSLSMRKEDIPLIIDYYLNKYNKEFGSNCKMAPEARDILHNYEWPGNTAEISNVISRLVLISKGENILSARIPLNIILNTRKRKPPLNFCYSELLDNFVGHLVSDLYAEHSGNREVISTILGVSKKKIDIILSGIT